MRREAELKATEIYGENPQGYIRYQKEAYINGYMLALAQFREIDDCYAEETRTNDNGRTFVRKVSFGTPFMLPAKIFIRQ